jgi:hypothetical protein
MTQYIKEYIEAFTKNPGLLSRHFFQELYQELARFDPRDFDPAVQALLVQARYSLRFASATSKGAHSGQMTSVLNQIVKIFAHYKGEGSRGIGRQFPVRGVEEHRDLGRKHFGGHLV